MAECSYARCLQERRLIKRELLKWSKDMLHIVGFERVAEELMGRRKWKHYQEAIITRTHSNITTNLNDHESLASSSAARDDTQLQLKLDVKREQEQEQEQHEHYERNHRQSEKASSDSDDTAADKAINSTSHNHSQETNNNNNSNNNNKSNITNLERGTSVDPNCGTPESRETPSPPESPAEAIDWQPNEKCYFCVDGKLLTVNAKGDLVAESGPAASASTDHGQRLDCDSDSNESSNLNNNHHQHHQLLGSAGGVASASAAAAAGTLTATNRDNLSKLLTSRFINIAGNMTSMDSMAAHLALQTISGTWPNLNWLQLAQQQQQQAQQQQAQQQQQQQAQQQQQHAQQQQQPQQLQTNSATPTTSDTSAAAISPSPKDSPSPSDATGEQPLDLSSKPSPNSSISGDLKSARTKSSRATPVPSAGRRTYSDEDLNNALLDIVSGKLGTRKAASYYNVPRSTLRNKVNKLTLEPRHAGAQTAAELLRLQHELDMEKDLSGDEEGGDDSNASTPPTHEDVASRIAASATLRSLCENNGGLGGATATLGNGSDVGGSRVSVASPKSHHHHHHHHTAAEEASKGRQTGTPSSSGGHHHQAPPDAVSPQPPLAPVWIDSNALLQTLLLSTGGWAALQPKLDETVTLRDLFNAIILNSGLNLKDTFAAAAAANANAGAAATTSGEAELNNGKAASSTSAAGATNNLVDRRLLLQQLQQHQQQQQAQAQSQHFPLHHLPPKPGTPETSSSLDPNEACDDPSSTSILKIPSYHVQGRSAAGPSSSSATTGKAARASLSPSLHCHANTGGGSNNNSNGNAAGGHNNNNNNNSLNCHTKRNGDSPHSAAPSPRLLGAGSVLAAAVAAGSSVAATGRQASGGNNNNNNNGGSSSNNNNNNVMSPPLLHHHPHSHSHAHPHPHHHHSLRSSDSQSPPSFSLQHVIASSIHRTMKEQANQEAQAAAAAAAAASMLGLGAADAERLGGVGVGSGEHKKPSISVVKNIGGTDTSRFGAAPNLLASVGGGGGGSGGGGGGSGGGAGHNSQHHHHHASHAHLQHGGGHHSPHHLSRQEAAALAAGKGTRPKRGKYRNYDRDSLVEAVKAVQRGEMSVHRAGSYYGVPHSTLEYKVKERHLMRPRKREPKPQPGLDGGGSGSTSSAAAAKANSNIPGHHHNSHDGGGGKQKSGGGSTSSKLSSALKANSAGAPAFPNAAAAAAATAAAAANGMKMSMFDPAVAVQLQYSPHLFWQHPHSSAFGHLPIDFNRGGAAQRPGGDVNADLILKSHMQAIRAGAVAAAAASTSSASGPANSPSPVASPLSTQAQHALGMGGGTGRDLSCDNLYESGGILDGIIRKTLESGEVAPPAGGGALLDQLLLEKKAPPLPYANSMRGATPSSAVTGSATSRKRASSPNAAMSYAEIKRERNSPAHSSDDDEDDGERDRDGDDDDASHSGADDAFEHNNNNSCKSNHSGNGSLMLHEELHHRQGLSLALGQSRQRQQRSRMTSHDSETDGSSIKSELMASHAHAHHNHSHALKLNGGARLPKGGLESPGGGQNSLNAATTSILQEKLAQIKAEQENEENL